MKAEEKAGRGLPPQELVAAQNWFGKAISRPLAAEFKSQANGLFGDSLRAEAEAHLRGSDGIGSLERLELYNRQYWFRLISVMQVDYTCTIHVMGLSSYNAWAVRYLDKHPPDSPYLNDLDRSFHAFMRSEYDGKDREWVMESLTYDRAFAKAFEGREGEVLLQGALAPGDMLQARLQLAPHVTALSLAHDWSSYRAEALKDESLEATLPLPEAMPFHRVVHRHEATLFEKEIPAAAAALLAALSTPATLPEVFDRMPDLSESDTQDLETHLTEWFADFVSRGWIVSANDTGLTLEA
jgi:Putative DNA-binding domain